MKLKTPQIYSQRDSRWASIFLGYNTAQPYTIGLYGCLITCLASYINKTPAEVNQILKDNNGFVSGGNFVWSKSTVLGLNQQYVSPSYSGPVTDLGVQKAQSYLDGGYPLLCEVDFNPATIGEEMHFVLITGYDGDNFTIVDPWTGTETSMDTYGGFRRGAIQFRAYDVKLPKDTGVPAPDFQAQLDQCRVDRDAHWNYILSLANLLNVQANESIITAEIKKLVGYEDLVVKQDAQIQDLQAQLTSVKNDLAIKTQDDLKAQQDLNTAQGQIDELQKKYQESQLANTDLSARITELEKAIVAPVRKGWKAFLVSLVDKL